MNVDQLYTLFAEAIRDGESRGASAPMWVEPVLTGLETRVIQGPACGASPKFRRFGGPVAADRGIFQPGGRDRHLYCGYAERKICQCEALLLCKPNSHRVSNAAAHRKNFMHMVGVAGKGQ